MFLSLRPVSSRALAILLLPLLLFPAACGRFAPKPATDYVYVSAKATFLRDRLAAVSNRVGEVTNGQRLAVIDHARRFVKVKTEKGEIGWIDEHAVITQQVYDQFAGLGKDHAKDSVIATAVLRDDSYLHSAPGRLTSHYYLLSENDKLQLLTRASVEKPMPPQALPMATPSPAKAAAAKKGTAKASASAAAAPVAAAVAPPVLQDWWLVRDSKGRSGWVWSRMLDIDIPAEIAGLAEGQKYIGAYVLRTVDDPDSNFPDKRAPEYVVALNSWKDGLPYDFDQIRVFTWNTKKHRYETAYRQRNLEGYLPLAISNQVFAGQPEPTFAFKVAAGEDVAIDPQSGAAHAAQTQTQTFRLEGVLVKRVDIPVANAPKPISPNPVKKTKHKAAVAEKRKKQKRR